MDKYNELIKLLEGANDDAEKFFIKGNNTAGTRLRKTMQEVKRLAQEIRISVSEAKK